LGAGKAGVFREGWLDEYRKVGLSPPNPVEPRIDQNDHRRTWERYGAISEAFGSSLTSRLVAVLLPDAVNKQLGLKLELRKHPMQVPVIDHVEEKPTDN
jgi:hypothetical protein